MRKIAVPEVPALDCDANAALGFAHNQSQVGRMKHIDLRDAWIRQLKDEGVMKTKVSGTDNVADTFTKIIPPAEFQKREEEIMPRI